MDNDRQKQQALKQLTELIEAVENDFRTDDIISWQQLFVLYFCITTINDDIPEDLLQRITDCGHAAHMWLLDENNDVRDNTTQCPAPPNGIARPGFNPLSAFFGTGAAKETDLLMVEALKNFASPEYVKALVLKDSNV